MQSHDQSPPRGDDILDRLYFKPLAAVAGERFDFIVIGAGAYGTSFARRVLELDPKRRVLVLEKGSFLIPEHIQNLPPTYVPLNLQTGVTPWKYTGTQKFMPQIPYVGGRALMWNAWIPQPPGDELPDWPPAAIAALTPQWGRAARYMGRRYSLETPGNACASLDAAMRARLFTGQDRITTAIPMGNPADLDSAMATGQATSPTQFAKFSPISVLIEDIQRYPDRLTVVANCPVVELERADDRVTRLRTAQGALAVGDAQVILALNTIEAGLLTTRSMPDDPLLGKNLCGHIRSWLAVRLPRDRVPGLTDALQVVAYYLRGKDQPTGRFMHTHITVADNPRPADSLDVLYKVLPDASTAQTVATYQDPQHVVFMLHAMGEILGTRAADSNNYVRSRGAVDEVHMDLTAEDNAFWDAMDRTVYQAIEVLTAGLPVEYQQSDGSWSRTRPTSIRNTGLVHEAGTLWMGDDPATSVTDPDGRMHRARNVYGTGSMLFPRPGSFNPTYTGVTMAFGLAERLTRR